MKGNSTIDTHSALYHASERIPSSCIFNTKQPNFLVKGYAGKYPSPGGETRLIFNLGWRELGTAGRGFSSENVWISESGLSGKREERGRSALARRGQRLVWLVEAKKAENFYWSLRKLPFLRSPCSPNVCCNSFYFSCSKWKSSITMMHQNREKNHSSMDVVGNRKKMLRMRRDWCWCGARLTAWWPQKMTS